MRHDWLDLFLADGTDAVRAGIAAGEPRALTPQVRSPAAVPATAAEQEGILAQQGKFVRLFQPFESGDGDWLAPGL